jgi:ABC-type glycerol-3-phosphate transport system substrate-binding protein
MKKLLSLALCAIMATCVVLTGCGGPKEETIDDSKSQLYVITSNDGYGLDWLSAIARKFEETYKNVSFEEGKKGVEIHESKSADAKGEAILNSFQFDDRINVCFANGLLYNQSIDKGLLADISDVVNGTFDTAVTDVDGNIITMGNDKIADMMFEQQKQVLSARDDKFYSIPWLFQIDGITYNKDIFIEKNLYFANDKVNAIYLGTPSSYTGTTYNGRGFIIETTDIKSPGPDGKLGTYDDGLPSSYEEFMYLLDYMKANNVVPFILANIGTWTYSNFLFSSLFTAYNGKEDTLVNYVGQTQGDNTVSIITGFNDNGPTI